LLTGEQIDARVFMPVDIGVEIAKVNQEVNSPLLKFKHKRGN